MLRSVENVLEVNSIVTPVTKLSVHWMKRAHVLHHRDYAGCVFGGEWQC